NAHQAFGCEFIKHLPEPKAVQLGYGRLAVDDPKCSKPVGWQTPPAILSRKIGGAVIVEFDCWVETWAQIRLGIWQCADPFRHGLDSPVRHECLAGSQFRLLSPRDRPFA